MWTAQLVDLNLAPAEGTDVYHFDTVVAAKAAWYAAYRNTLDCSGYWGGALPAMSDDLTVLLWRGRLTDVTDLYPEAEIVLGRNGGPVRRRLA